MSHWGIKYGKDLLELSGRILPEEKIIQLPDELGKTFKQGDFTEILRDRRMFAPRNMRNFTIISTTRDEGSAHDLFAMFQTVCGPMEMQIANPEL